MLGGMRGQVNAEAGKLFIPLKNYLILEGNCKYPFAPTWPMSERRCYNSDTS
jgi:hypothetical protein